MIAKELGKSFTNTEIEVDDTIQIVDWKQLKKIGCSINDVHTQHLAMVVDLEKDPFSEIAIGYWKKGSNQFVRQKTLAEDGTWDSKIKTTVDHDHIYQVIAIHTSYQQCSSADGTQIDISFKGFESPEFKWSNQTSIQDPNEEDDDISADKPPSLETIGAEKNDYIFNLKLQEDTENDENNFQKSQTLFSQMDTQNSQQCGVEPSLKTDEEEFKTDILHFCLEIDFNYLNEEKWPANMFLFHSDASGKVSYSGNTKDRCLTKISRDEIMERLQHDTEFPVQRKRGLQMEEDYEYFICPLAPELSAKVYEETFMQENESFLGQILEQGDMDDTDFKKLVKSKVRKHFGFLEVFKMRKNGTQYERTGKLDFTYFSKLLL